MLMRDWYFLIHIMKEELINQGKSKKEIDQICESAVKKLREKKRLQLIQEDSNITCFGIDRNDSIYEKIVFDRVFSEKEITEYRNEHWIHAYNSQWDCTGQWFTWSIDIFPIPSEGKTIVYHHKVCDC